MGEKRSLVAEMSAEQSSITPEPFFLVTERVLGNAREA